MKIIGIGIDIVQNNRFKKLIKNKKFLRRIFTSKEIMNSKLKSNKTNFFAKRFAAKESFVKATGYGFRERISFKDIEINNNKFGKPFYTLNSKIKKILKKKKDLDKFELFLSISDEKDYSIAFTILQQK